MNHTKYPPMKNTRFLDCLNGLPIGNPPPIWIMRQAGRYLPEFREIRRKHEFFEICRNQALACEVTLMPIKRFKMDAAIIFSDILVIPQALGMEVIMNPGPTFTNPLTLDTLDELNPNGAIDRLKYVGNALNLTRMNLRGEAALIGFSGAPWTLFSYMIEGGHSKTFSNARKWLYAHKKESRRVLDILTNVVADYCIMQAKAGAQAIQLFDTNAEYLSRDMYAEFCLPGLRIIRERVKVGLEGHTEKVPMIMFAKGGAHSLRDFAEMGYEGVSLDWVTEPSYARAAVQPNSVCFQGNLDPCALYANPKDICQMVHNMLRKFEGANLIVNLGHGIYPDTPLEGVEAFVNAVRDFSTSIEGVSG